MAALSGWSPPRLKGAPETLGLWNALTSYLGQPLPLRGQAVAVVDLAEPPAPDTTYIDLRFAAGPSLFLRPIAFPFASSFGADLTVDDLSLLPEALRDALHAGLVATFAAALPEHGLGEIDILRTGPLTEILDATTRESLRWFRAVLHGASVEPISLEFGASLDTLEQIFGGTLMPRTVWPALKQKLSRTADITLGRLRLPSAQVRTLRAGTVVVLDAGIETTARYRIGQELFCFEPAAQGWACVAVTPVDTPFNDPFSEPDSCMDRPSPSVEAHSDAVTPDRGIAVDRFAVAVDFDLGRVTVSIAELETWQIGSIVPLQPDVPREGLEVALRANGQLLGTGELIKLDDRLAVRLVRLTLAD